MHGLVYFALTHGVFSRKVSSECLPPASYRLAPPQHLPDAGAVDTVGTAMGLRTAAGKIALGGKEGAAVSLSKAARGKVTAVEGAVGGQVLESSTAGAISEVGSPSIRRLLSVVRRQDRG